MTDRISTERGLLMEDVFAAVDARPKRHQGVTGQTIEAQMRGTMCQISEYELEMLRDEITSLRERLEQAEREGFRAGIEAAAKWLETVPQELQDRQIIVRYILALAEQKESEQ